VDQSVLQFAAAAGVISGGLFLCGSGVAVALADRGGDHNATNPHSSAGPRAGKCRHELCQGGGGIGKDSGLWSHGHGADWLPPWSVSPVPRARPQPTQPEIVGATAAPVIIRPAELQPPPSGVGARAGSPPRNHRPPPRGPTPAAMQGTVGVPPPMRAGYPDYLHNAGLAEIAALAAPGVASILMLTAGGGFIGYRQAKAGHAVRTEGIARFLR